MSKIKLTVFFTPGGGAQAVYHDILRSLFSGPVEITRFSRIEFSHAFQRWEARDFSGHVLCMAETQEKCRQLEHALAEKFLEQKVTGKI